MVRTLPNGAVDLGDGRVAIAYSEDYDDYPVIKVLPREHYERMECVREKRRRLRLVVLNSGIKSRAAKRDRIQAKVSPRAFALWERRQDLNYWLDKVWDSESMLEQLYAANPFLDSSEPSSPPKGEERDSGAEA